MADDSHRPRGPRPMPSQQAQSADAPASAFELSIANTSSDLPMTTREFMPPESPPVQGRAEWDLIERLTKKKKAPPSTTAATTESHTEQLKNTKGEVLRMAAQTGSDGGFGHDSSAVPQAYQTSTAAIETLSGKRTQEVTENTHDDPSSTATEQPSIYDAGDDPTMPTGRRSQRKYPARLRPSKNASSSDDGNSSVFVEDGSEDSGEDQASVKIIGTIHSLPRKTKPKEGTVIAKARWRPGAGKAEDLGEKK